MKNDTLARPYAKAAYTYAKEHSQTKEWFDFLGQLGVLFADRDMQALLNDPTIPRTVLTEVLFEKAQPALTSAMQNFILQLSTNKRLHILPEIAALYAKDWEEDRQVRHVDVISAIPLSESEIKTLEQRLTEGFKQPIFMVVFVDPQLIGGIVIRSDDYVMDGSLKGQLNRLKHSFMNPV